MKQDEYGLIISQETDATPWAIQMQPLQFGHVPQGPRQRLGPVPTDAAATEAQPQAQQPAG